MMGQPRSWLLIPKHRDKDTAHKIEEAHDADTHCWSGSETTWLLDEWEHKANREGIRQGSAGSRARLCRADLISHLSPGCVPSSLSPSIAASRGAQSSPPARPLRLVTLGVNAVARGDGRGYLPGESLRSLAPDVRARLSRS
jgi:hypothetical protein